MSRYEKQAQFHGPHSPAWPAIKWVPTNQELKSQKKIELTRKQKNELKFLKFKIIGPQTNLWTKSTYTAR